LPAAPLVVCFCRRRLQQLACACGTEGWRVVELLNSTATLPLQEKKNSSVVQRSIVNIALSAHQPLALAAIYLSRAGVIGSVFAAVLTQA
jgi:hypothetical protein